MDTFFITIHKLHLHFAISVNTCTNQQKRCPVFQIDCVFFYKVVLVVFFLGITQKNLLYFISFTINMMICVSLNAITFWRRTPCNYVVKYVCINKSLHYNVVSVSVLWCNG